MFLHKAFKHDTCKELTWNSIFTEEGKSPLILAQRDVWQCIDFQVQAQHCWKKPISHEEMLTENEG